MFNYIALQHG